MSRAPSTRQHFFTRLGARFRFRAAQRWGCNGHPSHGELRHVSSWLCRWRRQRSDHLVGRAHRAPRLCWLCARLVVLGDEIPEARLHASLLRPASFAHVRVGGGGSVQRMWPNNAHWLAGGRPQQADFDDMSDDFGRSRLLSTGSCRMRGCICAEFGRIWADVGYSPEISRSNWIDTNKIRMAPARG